MVLGDFPHEASNGVHRTCPKAELHFFAISNGSSSYPSEAQFFARHQTSAKVILFVHNIWIETINTRDAVDYRIVSHDAAFFLIHMKLS